jgi:hypothetical protein
MLAVQQDLAQRPRQFESRSLFVFISISQFEFEAPRDTVAHRIRFSCL